MSRAPDAYMCLLLHVHVHVAYSGIHCAIHNDAECSAVNSANDGKCQMHQLLLKT